MGACVGRGSGVGGGNGSGGNGGCVGSGDGGGPGSIVIGRFGFGGSGDDRLSPGACTSIDKCFIGKQRAARPVRSAGCSSLSDRGSEPAYSQGTDSVRPVLGKYFLHPMFLSAATCSMGFDSTTLSTAAVVAVEIVEFSVCSPVGSGVIAAFT